MKLFIKSCFIVFILFQQAFSADSDLLKSVRHANSVLNEVKNVKSPCLSCQADADAYEQNCPEVIKGDYKEIYRMGTVGRINKLISDGSLKNPRSVCSTSANIVSSIRPEKLYKELQSQYPNERQLFHVSQKCNIGMGSDQNNFAASYMAYDFHYKSLTISASLTDLIESKAQIDSIIDGGTKMNCQEIAIETVRNRCQELNACPSKNKGTLLSVKTEELSEILGSIRAVSKSYAPLLAQLSEELKNVKEHNYLCRQLGCPELNRFDLNSDQKLTQKEADVFLKIKNTVIAKNEIIKALVDLNPLLNGNEFKKIRKSASEDFLREINPLVIETALKNQLGQSEIAIDKKIKEFNQGYMCLIGRNSNCDNLDEVLNESKYKNNDSNLIERPNLKNMASFYNCVKNSEENRDSASKVINGAMVSAALSLTPFVIISGAKLVMTVANVSTAVARAAQLKVAVASASIAVNMSYGGYHTKQIYDQCKDSLKDFKNLGATKKIMSCGDLDNILINKSNITRCTHQAILSAAMLIPPVATKAFKLAKLVK